MTFLCVFLKVINRIDGNGEDGDGEDGDGEGGDGKTPQ